MEPDVLECQDCGKPLHVLTPAEAQKVAANPQNYIVWCRECRLRIREQLEKLEA